MTATFITPVSSKYGAPMGRQIEALKAGAQIVVGTPGRMLDHMRRGTLKVNGVRMFVLDECDEMLSMGFQEDIEKIASELPAFVPFLSSSASDHPNIFEFEQIMYGVLIVAFLLFEPRGLFGIWHRIRTYWKSFPFSY